MSPSRKKYFRSSTTLIRHTGGVSHFIKPWWGAQNKFERNVTSIWFPVSSAVSVSRMLIHCPGSRPIYTFIKGAPRHQDLSNWGLSKYTISTLILDQVFPIRYRFASAGAFVAVDGRYVCMGERGDIPAAVARWVLTLCDPLRRSYSPIFVRSFPIRRGGI